MRFTKLTLRREGLRCDVPLFLHCSEAEPFCQQLTQINAEGIRPQFILELLRLRCPNVRTLVLDYESSTLNRLAREREFKVLEKAMEELNLMEDLELAMLPASLEEDDDSEQKWKKRCYTWLEAQNTL